MTVVMAWPEALSRADAALFRGKSFWLDRMKTTGRSACRLPADGNASRHSNELEYCVPVGVLGNHDEMSHFHFITASLSQCTAN